jgi:hypothetical protein
MSGRRSDDRGTSLVLVLGLSVLVLGLVLSAVTVAVHDTGMVRSDRDAKAALAAAQAGIDEYLARLITDDSYWSLGNGDSSNPAFTAPGRSIPGATGSQASYSYRMLNTPSDVARDGVVRLQVTGRSGAGGSKAPVSRTLTATLRPSGFLNYLAFIDVTTVDPDFLSTFTYVTYNGAWSTGGGRYAYVDLGAGIRSACAKHWYEGRDTPRFVASATTPVTLWDTWRNSPAGTITNGGNAADFSCSDVWYLNNVLRGPYHSNDTILVAGNNPLWTDPQFESSWETPPDPARRWYGVGTPSTGTVAERGYWPVYAPVIALPEGNQSLVDYAEPLPAGSTSTYHPGCRYTGITRIRFDGTSMKVLSPATTSAPSRCYDTLHPGVEQTVAVPPVIYVDATSAACTYGAVGYPRAGEWTGGHTTDYACAHGTALVEGTVDGRVTVGARDDIVITGDLTYADNGTGTDMLGLIADNKVWMYHPVDTSGGHNNLLPDASAIANVQAAILSVRHSYLLQNWDQGHVIRVTSSFLGSYAQKYMGPFGTFNPANNQAMTGYAARDLRYDARLRSIQPPFFLAPASSTWTAASVTDG